MTEEQGMVSSRIHCKYWLAQYWIKKKSQTTFCPVPCSWICRG